MNPTTSQLGKSIASLNDHFRKNLHSGRVLLTSGVNALPEQVKIEIINQVQQFKQFTPDNDPHGEHDFGTIHYNQHKFFWKIDYYDNNLQYGSNNPADPSVTSLILTIMLANEY